MVELVLVMEFGAQMVLLAMVLQPELALPLVH